MRVIHVFFFLLPVIKSGLVDAPVGCMSYSHLSLAICSGHGVCVDANNTRVHTANLPDTRCICDEGWTGLMDFINLDSHQCTQKMIVIKMFFGFNLLLGFMEFVMMAYKFCKCLISLRHKLIGQVPPSQSTETGEKVIERKKGGWFPYLKNFFTWTLVKMSLLGLVHSSSLFLLSFLRIYYYDTLLVGYSYAPTILFMIQDQTFWIAVRHHSLAMLKVRGSLCRFSGENKKQVAWAQKVMTKALYVIYLSDSLKNISVWLILFYPLQAQLLTLIYLQSLCFSIFNFAVLFYYIGKKIEAVLLSGFESLTGQPKKDRIHALKALRAVIVETIFGALAILPVLALFAWWPFLRSNLSYSAWQNGFPALVFIVNVSMLHPPAAAAAVVATTSRTSHRHHRTHTKFDGHSKVEGLTPSHSLGVTPSSSRRGSQVDLKLPSSSRRGSQVDLKTWKSGAAAGGTLHSSLHSTPHSVHSTPKFDTKNLHHHSSSASPFVSESPTAGSMHNPYASLPPLDLSSQRGEMLASTQENENEKDENDDEGYDGEEKSDSGRVRTPSREMMIPSRSSTPIFSPLEPIDAVVGDELEMGLDVSGRGDLQGSDGGERKPQDV